MYSLYSDQVIFMIVMSDMTWPLSVFSLHLEDNDTLVNQELWCSNKHPHSNLLAAFCYA